METERNQVMGSCGKYHTEENLLSLGQDAVLT